MLRHYDDARRDLPAGGYDPRRLVSPGLTPGAMQLARFIKPYRADQATSRPRIRSNLPLQLPVSLRAVVQTKAFKASLGIKTMTIGRAVIAAAKLVVLMLRPAQPSPAAYSTADSLKHLLRSPHSGLASPLRAVARDSGSFRRLWAEAVRGDPSARPMPRIEFEHNMVIVAAMGSRPSTGFGITIDSVVVRGPSMEVHVVLSSPGSLCIQGMALTSPVDIVEVPTSVRVVLFRDREVTVECKMP